jgi:hypothetical protein
MVFGTSQPKVPVVGVCLVEAYEGAHTETANAAIQRLIASKEVAVVQVDTRLDENSTSLRSPAEIESLIARVDIVVTTRLHGTVLALKNGVPVLAIDPEAGGAKIRRQAQTIGWPILFTVENLSDEALSDAFDYCLTAEARRLARQCGDQGAQKVATLGEELVAALRDSHELEASHKVRIATSRNLFQSQESAISASKTAASEDSLVRRMLQKLVGATKVAGTRQMKR